MDKDLKSNKSEDYCEVCDGHLCSNCGKCCHCGKCDCDKCHPKEEDNEPGVEEPVNYS